LIADFFIYSGMIFSLIILELITVYKMRKLVYILVVNISDLIYLLNPLMALLSKFFFLCIYFLLSIIKRKQ